MKKTISLVLLIAAFAACQAREISFHCPEDTVTINRLLTLLRGEDIPVGDRMAIVAQNLMGADEDDYYLTDSVGDLRINMDSFTPLMFVNNVIAIAKASDAPGNPDWHTFRNEFVDISCRRGDNGGYPSIMYHTSDWIGDNVSRGNLRELTEDYAGVVARTKSLDEMTRKRTDYAPLADSTTFETIRMIEMGFRTHRVPTLKKETIKKKEIMEDLRDGDIILLVPNRDGIDMYDIGIVKKENGVPYFIHLSPQTHRVVKEKDDLSRYMALMTKHFQGYRLLRVKE